MLSQHLHAYLTSTELVPPSAKLGNTLPDDFRLRVERRHDLLGMLGLHIERQ